MENPQVSCLQSHDMASLGFKRKQEPRNGGGVCDDRLIFIKRWSFLKFAQVTMEAVDILTSSYDFFPS